MVDLSKFENGWYDSGRPFWVQGLWFFCGLPLLRCPMMPFSSIRRGLLRLFGARIGTGVVVKPGVRVKYPWRLSVGSHAWIGEDCWIDNLADVSIGSNVCISQGAYLCTGNHDWSDPAFGLVVQGITLGDGAWVGAKALICPGVAIFECGIAAAGSVVSSNIPPYEIHAGNPARLVSHRKIQSGARLAAGSPLRI